MAWWPKPVTDTSISAWLTHNHTHIDELANESKWWWKDKASSQKIINRNWVRIQDGQLVDVASYSGSLRWWEKETGFNCLHMC